MLASQLAALCSLSAFLSAARPPSPFGQDHIYSYRSGGAYSHHGIYVGRCEVVHLLGPGVAGICSGCSLPASAESMIVRTSIDDFARGEALHRAQYSCSLLESVYHRGHMYQAAGSEPAAVLERGARLHSDSSHETRTRIPTLITRISTLRHYSMPTSSPAFAFTPSPALVFAPRCHSAQQRGLRRHVAHAQQQLRALGVLVQDGLRAGHQPSHGGRPGRVSCPPARYWRRSVTAIPTHTPCRRRRRCLSWAAPAPAAAGSRR